MALVDLTPEQWIFFRVNGFLLPGKFRRPVVRNRKDAASLDILLNKLNTQSSDTNLVSACLHVLKDKPSGRPAFERVLSDAKQCLRGLRKINRRLDGIMRVLEEIEGSKTRLCENLAFFVTCFDKYLSHVTITKNVLLEHTSQDFALLLLIDDLRRGKRLPRGTWVSLAAILDSLGREMDPENRVKLT